MNKNIRKFREPTKRKCKHEGENSWQNDFFNQIPPSQKYNRMISNLTLVLMEFVMHFGILPRLKEKLNKKLLE